MSRYLLPLIAIFSCASSTAAFADYGENTATVTVNVTIVTSPCEINNNQQIDIDFGSSIAVTDVAAGLVQRNIDYTLDCSSADQSKTLVMKITGPGATFNTDELQTNIPQLGIGFTADGSEYALNTPLPFASADTKPALVAKLMQQDNARLPTGNFTAGATMTVEYQ